jgi:hypothetical protein
MSVLAGKNKTTTVLDDEKKSLRTPDLGYQYFDRFNSISPRTTVSSDNKHGLNVLVRNCRAMFTNRWVAKRIPEGREKYSGSKITASFGNVTVRGKKIWKGQGGSTMAKSLSEHV